MLGVSVGDIILSVFSVCLLLLLSCSRLCSSRVLMPARTAAWARASPADRAAAALADRFVGSSQKHGAALPCLLGVGLGFLGGAAALAWLLHWLTEAEPLPDL